MKISKFTNLYPCTLYITVFDEASITQLLNRFVFYLPNKLDTVNDRIIDEFDDYNIATTRAMCCPVMDNETFELGILLIIVYPDLMNAAITAHESVHIADYYFERCGLNSESFTEGNETYAYLVEWAAGCITKVMKEYGETK